MFKRLVLLVVAIFLVGVRFIELRAQSADESLIKLADEMYGFGDKKDALSVYLQAVEVNPESAEGNYKVGKCYLETVGKELSASYLIKAYQLKPTIAPDILYKIGIGFQIGGKFDDAVKYFNLYKENVNDATAKLLKSSLKDEIIKTDRKIFECQNGAKYYSNINHYRIENIKDVVNSEYPDYVPTISADQSTLIFTSRRAGGVGKNKDIDNEYFEDIWISKKDSLGEWGEPQNLGAPVNTESHDANIGLSPDGKKLFIRKPENEGDIFSTELLPSGKWLEPISLGNNINSKYDESSVSITNDGKTLYFSSNRPGGFGGFDIYKSELDKTGKWGKPSNMGSIINTEYDEDAPFIDKDILYFSSRGLAGMGGYDIYKSTFDSTKKTWKEPVNMGYPVNSPDEDIYFVVSGDGKTGYYASAKGDGYGDKDIYKIYFEEPKKETEKKDSLAVMQKTKADSTKFTPAAIKSDTTSPIAKIDKQDTLKTKPIAVKSDTTSPAISKTEKKETLKSKPVAVKSDSSENAVAVVAKSDSTANKTSSKTITQKVPIAEKKSIPKPIVAPIVLVPSILKGSIYDQKSNVPLSAKMVISDAKGTVLTTIDIDESGNYSTEFSIKTNTKYQLTVTKQGYIYVNIPLVIPANAKVQKIITRDIALKKTGVGQIFVLRNIYFDFDKANIKKESFQYLDNLVKWLNQNSEVSLEIGGHTDNLGLDSYNKILSQNRVNSVMRYLTAKGIRGDRLVAIGYGEDRPIASNDDDQEGREINRRTEFKITKH